jgi:lipopolysaccharide transport system permease protein
MSLETAAKSSTSARRLRRSRPLAGRHAAHALRRHWRLLLRVTRTDVATRYAGSLLGPAWVLAAPLLFLGVYALVYLVIFPFQPEGFSSLEYMLYIFAGLVPFFAMSEAIGQGVTSVVTNKAILNNVVFPIELVPAKAVLAAQATMAVGFTILLVGTVAAGRLSWTAALVPVVWILNALALVGVTWILSLLNIVFRDLTALVGVVLMLILIASPIAYTPSIVPDSVKFILYVNPFAYYVVAYQKLWLLGELPTLFEGFMLVALSLGAFVLGGWFFSRAKRVLIDYV